MVALISVAVVVAFFVPVVGITAWKRRAQIRVLQEAHADAIVRWVVLQDRKSFALVITDTTVALLTLEGRLSEQWPRTAVMGAHIEKLGPAFPRRPALVVHFSPSLGHDFNLPMFFPRGDGFTNSSKLPREIQAVLRQN